LVLILFWTLKWNNFYSSTLGFIVEYLLKVPLTTLDAFHSHLERMDHIDVESFHDQVMWLWSIRSDINWIIISIKSLFLFSVWLCRSRSVMHTLKTTGMLCELMALMRLKIRIDFIRYTVTSFRTLTSAKSDNEDKSYRRLAML
jgi:hypothetical protein